MDTFFILSAKYLIIVSVLLLGIYFVSRRWPAQKFMALFAVPAGLFAYVLGRIAGALYYDPRPFVSDHITPLITHAADNGFPSDHTLLAAALAMVGTYWDRRLGAALWVLTAIIAIARVYVGVHHAVDVIASIGISIVAVWAVHTIIEWKHAKHV